MTSALNPALTPAIKLSHVLTAVAAGAVHALSFAATPTSPPYWWLQIAALSVLACLVLSAQRPANAGYLGYAFGLGWFGVGVHWIFISLHIYGDMNFVLSAAAVVAFCAFLALFPGLATWVSVRLSAPSSLPRLFLLAAAWGASEWLRGTIFTGFPWIATGYAHADGPLSGYAPVVGAQAMSTLAMLCAGGLSFLVVGPRRRWGGTLLAALLLTGAGLRLVTWTHPSGHTLNVRLVQGHVAQDVKFQPDKLLEQLLLYYQLAVEAPADLIVLPETAFPVPMQYLPEGFFAEVTHQLEQTGSALLTGIPVVQQNGSREDWYNAVIDQEGRVRYAKHHLVPFGEYIPRGFAWFVAAMNMPLGEFARGQLAQTPFYVRDQRIGINICYEDWFGAEIAAALRRDDAPTMLLNVSNIAWFGRSIALPQHLLASRLRALETGRPVMRGTNTGVTAVIAPDGSVLQRLAPFTRATLHTQVQGYAGTTPYLKWGEWGFVVLLLLLFLCWATCLTCTPTFLRKKPTPPGACQKVCV